MPTKRVPCWKDKPVLVSVYVERPKRGPASTTRHHHHHHHHHHHVHHTIKQEVIHHGDGTGGKGYTTSRRAELLQYSQRLRQSARTAAPPPPSIPSVPNPNHTSNPQPLAEIVAVPRKPKNAKAPSCFGNCNLPTIFGPLTSFHAKKERKTRTKRSGHASNKIKAAIKTLKVQKQQDFFT